MQSIVDSWYEKGTLVIGHRGAKAYAPMNTLPAFELAVAQGADGIELDVHRSKDGHAVIVHDFTVDSTTDGSGYVTDMTLAELKALDAGGWFSEEFRGVRIPTLIEVFQAMPDDLIVNVEIKSDSEETDGVEQVVADVIRQFNAAQRVIISSFNPLTLQRCYEIMPEVPLGFLYSADSLNVTGPMMDMLSVKPQAQHPEHTMIDAGLVQQVHEVGGRINTWTVNDPARAVVLRDLGVDAIITDNPDTVLAALRG